MNTMPKSPTSWLHHRPLSVPAVLTFLINFVPSVIVVALVKCSQGSPEGILVFLLVVADLVVAGVTALLLLVVKKFKIAAGITIDAVNYIAGLLGLSTVRL